LGAVVRSAPDVILNVAIDGTILLANRPVLGVPPDQLVGRSFHALPPPENEVDVRAEFEHVVRTGEPGGYEVQVAAGDGTPRWYSVKLGPANHDGRVVAIVVIARDITDNKRTEMQLMLADRMASVGTLAAGVAHEINNPLASVIANLDMAKQDVDDLAKRAAIPKDLPEELHDARVSAGRVREIVRDLKIFARAQEDRRGAVDVELVLDSTLRMAWNELRHRAKLVKTYGKVPRVDANESRLGQVFLNLIVNAAQAIPEGNHERNEIRVATRLVAGKVVISIADTGSGIKDDVKHRLFTPFFTTKPIGIGTGLGLAISHRIVAALGGSIEVETEVGKGTEFRVVLPVAPPALETAGGDSAIGVGPTRRGSVLVIDDEESLAQAMRRYLAVDHEVEAMTSARAALELIAAGRRFDVILCDVMMPNITGMDFHARVAELEPALASRIAFVTGGAFTASAREFLDRVPNRRIEKPFDLKALRALVNELVG
ncbi:MAG TPA: ATP-binding protein, partial [Kofleriaceae bacterium]|nr:ATP-binding protein [Kofleriaceae bacterium]